MKMLTAEITKLLDKLYNLRGDDSIILSKIEKEKIVATETRERTTEEKGKLQEKIENLTEEERVLGEEGEKLIQALSHIKTDDFKFVLNKLNIDFDPEKLNEEVSRLLPRTIDKVKEETDKAKNELVEVESEMNSSIATIEELAIRKDEALENQARLNEYFELALKGNINITRDSITSLLEKFDFNEDERREAAKLMMFPEDALFDYEEKIKNANQSGKSISDVFQEAKENASDVVEVETPQVTLSPREILIKVLEDLGFDYLDFTSNDLEKVLANYNETNIRKNVNYAKAKNLNLDLFIDNVELLYDAEFDLKVDKLIEIGKEPFDIYLNPNILIKYSKNDLDNTINKLISGGLDPKKVPLIAY